MSTSTTGSSAGPYNGPSTGPTSAPIHASGGGRRTGIPLATLVLVAAGAALLGLVVGRLVAPAPAADAATIVERDVVPLSVDADGLWAAGSGDLPAISEHLSTLRRDGVNDDIGAHAEAWLDQYDSIVRRMVGVDVPAPARPVQRQFVHAVTLSRDALEVMVEASEADDPARRRDLSSEALRLRTRSEQLTQTARASLSDLRGGGSGVAEPATLPSLSELR